MPMTPRCQPSPPTTSTLCAPTAGSVSIAFLACATSSASSCWRRRFSSFSCCASAARLVAHRLAGGEQQPGRDVRRAHAPGGVDARRDHERDLVAVDRLAGEAGRVEQRAQPDGVRPEAERRQAEPRDHAVLADQRDDVGQRADGGDLDERRQPLAPCRRGRTAPAPASARRRRRPGACPDRCSRAASG